MSLEALVKRLGINDEQFVAKLQEITSDDVIKADIAKELMWKRASLLSVGEKVVPVRNIDTLERKIYWPDLENVSGEFPVPETATAARSPPVQFIEFDITMQMAEYRWMITYWAKARQQANWQMEAQIRAGSQFFARCIDQQILDALYAGAGATPVTVAAGKEWDSGSADADPEGDIIKAWNNILDESNVGLDEIQNVCLIYPAKVDAVLRSLKMIGNIQQSLQDYLKGSYGFSFYPTRYYDETGTTGIQDDALLVVKSEETAVHYKYTGNDIPLSMTRELDRGIEYITRQIFGTKVVPSSSGVTTSTRICKIQNVI
ncbi:MAG: hypothetical protein DRO14_05275 [Thermoprotei archaeon]|nr:MAG: hypothetical protein DRO14_05275 [Thermoprotei archaeon]